MKDLDFTGKTVLIIGGSSGIGNGMAHAFKDRGATVYVSGTRPSSEDYKDQEGSDLNGLHYCAINITDPDALENFDAPFSSLDILIQCQGIVRYNREEFLAPGWKDVMDVNINSVMYVAQRFQPLLAESHGSLIIVSSVAGFHATRGNPAYGASKAGAVSLTATLGEAWATYGIRVNGIAPGFVDTKLTKVTTGNDKRLEATLKSIPQKRLGTPEDMAGAALFLASPLASYICGQTLLVDGGLNLS